MEDEKFDAIVVGAGPAGLAAAYVMAQAGLMVAVLERGDFPGAKNVMGGVLYRQPTQEVFGEFWRSAPVERHVDQQSLWILSQGSAVQIGHKNEIFAQEPYNAFTVLRAKFDKWLGKQVSDAGALIVPETLVEEVIRKDGKVVGVRTGREEGDLYADVVIAADGVNSTIARKAGLHGEWKPNQVALAVKEIIALPRERIQDRFHLEEEGGATIELVGAATGGMMGTGFIYTNKDSLSIGVGAVISDLVETKTNANDLLEQMKAHPAVRPLVEGGETREYMAHLIPEGGYHGVPQLFTDGLLVVGDAAMLVNSYHREGSNLAITSGRLAAETVIAAKKRADFSAASLSEYKRRLDDSFVMKDLRKYANASSFFEKNKHFFTLYPDLANMAAAEFLTVDSVPKRQKQWGIVRKALRARSVWGMIRDGIGAARRMV